MAGCKLFPTIPFKGDVHADAHVATSGHMTAGVNGTFDIRLPAAPDPGPVIPVMIKTGANGPESARVAIIDVDGLLLNQNFTGSGSVGENPVASFKEKLDAAACDPRVRAVVLRINSPGGGVAASDLMAEELYRFRKTTRKPTVACMLDVATSGALYLAVGCDRIIALPTTITGGIGALLNHSNLKGASNYFSSTHETVKSGENIDMGSVSAPLGDTAPMFQEMTDGFHERFIKRVVECRPATLKPADPRKDPYDGRIFPATRALALHLVDALGYPEDAVSEAERLSGAPGAEIVIIQRESYPTRSIYATVPNIPQPIAAFPSIPALDRAKLPTFLYLWQPDSTITKVGNQ
jgi:protease IV